MRHAIQEAHVWTALGRFAYKSANFLVPFVSSCSATAHIAEADYAIAPPPPPNPGGRKKRHGMQGNSGRFSVSLQSLRRGT